MARLKDDAVQLLLNPHLKEGETLKHWAYGVKQPPIILIFSLMLLGILPGVIAVFLLTKNYIVGLTDKRFIVLKTNSSAKKTEELTEYSLSSLPKVKTSTGSLFTHIKLEDPTKPFVAKFHRLGMPNNRQHSMAIAAALSGQPVI